MVRAKNSSAEKSSSYNLDGFPEIVRILKGLNPDIITLQEVHSDGKYNQAEVIARQVGLKYVVSDFSSNSHILEGQRLGQAILSRYPITGHTFRLFLNPHYEIIWEDGTKALSYDKGVTQCTISVGRLSFDVMTLHLIPFRRFSIDPQSQDASAVLVDVQDKLTGGGQRLLVQGDFNLDFSSMSIVLPAFMQEKSEVIQSLPTTPDGARLDHIVYKGMSLEKSTVLDDVVTDHFPIVSSFVVKSPTVKYVALLRGINVGGKNKVSMGELRSCFEQIGFNNVSTYINSGNIIFESDITNVLELKELCEQAIERQFGFLVACLVISRADYLRALAEAPKWWNKDAASKHNTLFVIPPKTTNDIVQEVGQTKPEYEYIKAAKNVIFWSAPLKTFGRTRYGKVAGTTAYQFITVRNANTTIKIANLLGSES